MFCESNQALFLKQVGEEVAKVDGMIGALLAALAEAHLDDKVNVVVTSTPGFSGVRPGLNYQLKFLKSRPFCKSK